MRTCVIRGTAALLGFLLTAMLILSALAFQRADDVNDFLDLKAPGVVNTNADTQHYKTEFTADGLLSEAGAAALIQAADEFAAAEMEEGAVLLTNRNGALPLKEEERKVTLFGRSVADPVYKNASGGPITVGSPRLLTLHDAFVNGGFQINEELFQAYQASAVRRSKYGTDTVTKSAGSGDASIGEVDISFYTDKLKATFSGYSDVAVVMFSREAGEGTDVCYDPTHEADRVPQLALHRQEADLLKMIKTSGAFKKTVVLINSGNIMDLDWVNDYDTYGVDACLYIGQPGTNGCAGVVDLLTGAAVPSGKLSDTAAMDSLSSPAMRNLGDYEWENLSYLLERRNNSARNEKYMVYAEGIYVGYKYYETRYYDAVLGQFSADSAAGRTEVHHEGGEDKAPYPQDAAGWDYSVEMAFPFGYGLSYTTFSQTLKSLDYDPASDAFTAVVGVTNTGETYSGKSVVQLYVCPPYTDYDRENLVERPAIQLAGFGKTALLAPGQSQDVTVTVDRYYLAAYDGNAAKTYILEPGDYWFTIGDDVHDALNNMIAASHPAAVRPLTDHTGAEVTGDAAKARAYTVDSFDASTYSVTDAGNPVTNVFEGDAAIDLNDYVRGGVTYLTRGGGGKDWESSYPQTVRVSVDDRMIYLLDGYTYQTPAGMEDVSAVTLNRDAGLKLTDMMGIPLEDGRWDAFVQQMNITELVSILDDYKGFSAPVEKIGRTKIIRHSDGPNGFEIKCDFGEVRDATCYVSECLAAATWNLDLLRRRGELMGEEALYAGCSMLWGPGINIHRTPYSERNFEYFSEDPILTLQCAAAQNAGSAAKGLICGGKHLVGNDQEVNRNGVAEFMTEQTLRETYLRPFEVLTMGEFRVVMCAENRLGLTAISLNQALMEGILREEWGYDGIIISDAANDLDYMHPREGLAYGTDMWCLTKKYAIDIRKYLQTDANLIQKLQESNKRVYHAYVNSNYMNGLTAEVAVEDWTPWWQPVVVAANAAVGLGFAACLALFLIYAYGKRGKKQ